VSALQVLTPRKTTRLYLVSGGIEHNSLLAYSRVSSGVRASSTARYTLHTIECIRPLEEIMRASATLPLSCTVCAALRFLSVLTVILALKLPRTLN